MYVRRACIEHFGVAAVDVNKINTHNKRYLYNTSSNQVFFVIDTGITTPNKFILIQLTYHILYG